MARKLLLAVSHPYSTFFNLIRHPQLLTEHSSGWFALLLGYSLLVRSVATDRIEIRLSYLSIIKNASETEPSSDNEEESLG